MSNPLHRKDTKEQERPPIPLPDPENVKHTFDVALAKVRERQSFYVGMAAVVLLVALGAIYFLTAAPTMPASQFNAVWQRAEAAKAKLVTNQSAAKELAELEAYLPQVRDTEVEAETLWLLGIYHYREAWTDDKTTTEERRHHLEKAIGFLSELQQPRFDEFLLTKPNWFASGSSTPASALLKQVKADLEWIDANAYTEPAPSPGVVAVLRTSEGDVHLQFFADLCPEHMKNFVTLARKGTYNETLFYFSRRESAETAVGVAAGDPFTFFYNDPKNKKHLLRWGKGGVGYEIQPEAGRYRISHRAGVVTSQMADDGDWDNGARFMIMTGADTELDKRNTPFARVVEGQAIVDKIAARKTAGQNATFKDDPDFSTIATRDLIVEPAILHKVIVYENGKALEHDFPLSDSEKSLATLSDAPVQPLTGDAAYCGRLLRNPETATDIRLGLDIPFPEDVEDMEKADPKGERISAPAGSGSGSGDSDK